VHVTRSVDSKWTPPPREVASLTSVDMNAFLIGGMNYEAIREITKCRILGDTVHWERQPFTTGIDTIYGR
jgi:hypothetical protein